MTALSVQHGLDDRPSDGPRSQTSDRPAEEVETRGSRVSLDCGAAGTIASAVVQTKAGTRRAASPEGRRYVARETPG